jgi:hypothetical protein
MAIESWIQLREGLHVAAADDVCCWGDAQAVNQGHVRWEGEGMREVQGWVTRRAALTEMVQGAGS